MPSQAICVRYSIITKLYGKKTNISAVRFCEIIVFAL
jgi:hypothetical protein